MSKLVELFCAFFKISAFVIGGGYAIIAVADEIFAKKGWTKEGELIDHLPVFQTIPGLIATHTAVYVGNKVAGWIGSLVAVVAVAIPAVVCFTLIAIGYAKLNLAHPILQGAFVGLRAALTGIIAATVIRSWKRNLNGVFAYALMLIAASLVGLAQVNVALVLVGAMLMGIGREFAKPKAGVKVMRSFAFLPLLVFLKYGALCFGGGFVLVPMYLQDFVGETAPYLQIGVEEFSNIMALSQMTPGPIGVNCATFFGYRLAGIAGALIASFMLLAPGSVLVFLAIRSLDRFRENRIVIGLMQGIRPASVALMLVALVAFARFSCASVLGGVLTLVVAALVYFKKLGIIRLIFLSGLLGIAINMI